MEHIEGGQMVLAQASVPPESHRYPAKGAPANSGPVCLEPQFFSCLSIFLLSSFWLLTEIVLLSLISNICPLPSAPSSF